MATNGKTGDGHRNGAVRGRSQTYNQVTETWTKRDTSTGKFMDGKSDGAPFKALEKKSKMKLSRKYNLKSGDSLIHPIDGIPDAKHFGVFLGEDHFGVELFSENQKFVGVRVLNREDYIKANGAPERVERLICSDQDRYTAVRRALQEAGKPYDLVVYNCEHYARFVQTGSSTSNQVGNVLAGLLLGALVYCFSAD